MIYCLMRPTCWALFALAIYGTDAHAARVLVDLDQEFKIAEVKTRDTQVTLSGRALQLTTGHDYDWPGIVLTPPGGHWNLSEFGYVAVDVKNVGQKPVAVSCRLDNPGGDGSRFCITRSIVLPPGGQAELQVPMSSRLPQEFYAKLFGMRGLPGGVLAYALDPANVTSLRVFVANPTEDHCFEISNLRADGAPPPSASLPEDGLFPLIDSFGQYRHKGWPGKIKSIADLISRKEKEAADLAAHPSQEDWDQYGGWKTGPQLPATGFFRVEKHEGKWWFVDPEGRLFWSHGINCVRSWNATTPITDRANWFADLPKPDSVFAEFYSTDNRAPRNYYEGRKFETFNFTGANLLRKYGEDWPQTFSELTHRRLRSWGINTIANWSDPAIYLMQKTPYTATFNVASKTLAGSEGYWCKFADVFDPAFPAAARRQMAEQKGCSAGDPWCIGYFVDNELTWGNAASLAVATLRSPPEQPAKQEFVADLKKKYATIEQLNAAWDTQHTSWEAFLESTTPPERAKARHDFEAFSTKMAERYFEVCRTAIQEAAPRQLYLGCRFSVSNDLAVRAAAKYCDVVSFNLYKQSATDLRLPEGIDKPIIIGEFHFGALDRGMFHPGLVPTANQNDRAEAYKTYVRSALKNPWIVGTHWFQFSDQATTGRGDGENYQIGFVDACDTPYVEIIEASRDVARDMYDCRSGK